MSRSCWLLKSRCKRSLLRQLKGGELKPLTHDGYTGRRTCEVRGTMKAKKPSTYTRTLILLRSAKSRDQYKCSPGGREKRRTRPVPSLPKLGFIDKSDHTLSDTRASVIPVLVQQFRRGRNLLIQLGAQTSSTISGGLVRALLRSN